METGRIEAYNPDEGTGVIRADGGEAVAFAKTALETQDAAEPGASVQYECLATGQGLVAQRVIRLI